MPISFAPKQWSIVRCDYGKGFIEPEMVKRRPVIVVSLPLNARKGLSTVIPLSTSEPSFLRPWQCVIELDIPLPKPWTTTKMWAKCDMINAVSWERLDLIRTERSASGKREYYDGVLRPDQIIAVKTAIVRAWG